MSSDHLIFVGFELTKEVISILGECHDRDRIYLEDPNFLETVAIDGKKYIGKRVKDAAAIDRVEDTARSVVSLLSRANPEWKLDAVEAMVLAVEDESGPPAAPSDDGEEESSDFDYLGLVD